MRVKPMSAKQKVNPSGKVIARAFAQRRVEASKGVLERVFAERSLERISNEDTNAWFKKTVIDAFKKWHSHSDGSVPQARIVGSEDVSSSQSGLEKSLGNVKLPSGNAPAGKYDIKKADAKGDTASGGVSYKLDAGKGGSEIKYTTTTDSNINYKTTGATGVSYQQHTATQYSKDSGANVQCSCGMVAHAGMQNDGKIGFSAVGNTKNDSNIYSQNKAGGSQQSSYQLGGSNVSYTS